nr:MAG: RNA-dependent RNA polymerase [Porcine picobirnavirus]
MTKKSKLMEEYFFLPNPNLRSWFGRTRKGVPQIVTTPLGKSEEPSALLDEWTKHLTCLKGTWPGLWKFEMDMAAKVGPMSYQLPLSERMLDIDSYYDSILYGSKPVSQRALDVTLGEWGKKSISVRSPQETILQMKLSTSSGSPYFTKRRNVYRQALRTQVTRDSQIIDGNEYKLTAILGWRGQEGGPDVKDVKQRVIWMFPFAVNLQELRVYQPLIEYAQREELVPAWISMDKVDREITALLYTKAEDDLVICTDFTKFDQHFNCRCSEAAEYLLRGLLIDSDDSEYWMKEIFPIKYRIPMCYDWGMFKRGFHGMASGSGGTNADETLVHRALQHEAAISAGAILNPHSQCLGDDGIISFHGITVDKVLKSYTQHGLNMNESKQSASTTECVYLRRWHHKDYRINEVCVGVYSTCRALGRLMYQERYYDPDLWGKEMVALRQLSILENVKYHPLRNEFAQFIMKRDKYRLGLDIPGFLDNIDVIASEARANMDDFLGYTKSQQYAGDSTAGIASWWIVRYLKSMA